MRLIIRDNYDLAWKWEANYIARKINLAAPTAEKPYVLGLPTGSWPMGIYGEFDQIK